MQLALLNFVGGDMAAGERGLLSLPEGSAAFRANIDVCAGIAARTGCTILNALYGNRADGLSRLEQDELARRTSRWPRGPPRRPGRPWSWRR